MNGKKLAFFLSAAFVSAVLQPSSSEARVCYTGDRAEVWVDDAWLPGLVIKTTSGGNRCRVHYDKGARHDEWVNPKRLRMVTAPKNDLNKKYSVHDVGDSVMVFSDRKWRKARITQVKKNEYHVDYDARGEEHSEWVKLNQIRAR